MSTSAMLVACRLANADPVGPASTVTGERGAAPTGTPDARDQAGDVGPEYLLSRSKEPVSVSPVELVWQTRGGSDRLRFPTGLAVDPHGTLTVVDAGNDQLVELATGAGEASARLGEFGAAPGRFYFMEVPDMEQRSTRVAGGGVAIDQTGDLYIADSFNRRIQRRDRAGQFIATWGATVPGPLVEPTGIAVDDRRGRVYVADAGTHYVHSFDRDGHWQGAWGSPGQGPGQFGRPVALAVDGDGRVYVADQGNDLIQVFDPAGQFVTAWGGPGVQPGDFTLPVGVAVDGDDRVYVATTRRVLVFSNTGVFLAGWDGAADSTDVFGVLGGIAVDEQGAIYITDQIPSRVLKFRPRGPWPAPAAVRPTPRPATATPTAFPSSTPPLLMTPTDR
jgi:DNA-binding beta-propeller fold protein YncE